MALAAIVATPVAARDHGPAPMAPGSYSYGGGYGAPYGGSMPGTYGAWQQPYSYPAQQAAPDGPPPQNRDDWLRECRRRIGDNGVGGAVIGGVLGGVAGNVIAKHGDKILGTVAGAAVGAVAGAAIDKAEDRSRTRDRCEAMLDTPPQAPQGAGYPGYGYPGYGMMMVPVMMVPMQQPAQPRGECTETITTTEYVTYETRRSRVIPRRAPTKVVRIVPDKRVRIAPDKRVVQ
jgi:uncharacterized protein YcfJ